MRKINFKQLVKDGNDKTYGIETPCVFVDKDKVIQKDEKGDILQGVITDPKLQKNYLDMCLQSIEYEKNPTVMTTKEKNERWELFKKLRDSKKTGNMIIEIEPEEETLLIKCVEDCQKTHVWGQFKDYLKSVESTVSEPEKKLKKVK
jgi:hypothetical protein